MGLKDLLREGCLGGSDDDGGSGGASWVSDLDTGVKAEA